MAYRCKCCGGSDAAAELGVREMMFGTRETFTYEACAGCGSLQIRQVPEDLPRYYGDGYYSFQGAGRSLGARLRAAVARQRDRGCFGAPLLRGLARRWPAPLLETLIQAGLRREARLLDVGCGAGHLLDRLAQCGFKELSGADPFIETDFTTPAGVPVAKRYLSECTEPQDIILFNHALEHVTEPAADLQKAHDLLAPGGLCIIRIPALPNDAFDTYGANWVQLDAPRHIFVPSRDGMAALAARCGFDLEQVIDDGRAFGYWGSVLYVQDIPLSGQLPEAHFTPIQLAQWAARAAEMNQAGRGDQAAFVLRKR
ncbi:class I SAM-dependent methyltransferase (plasmid) [Roseobacteraceae bacterium NS-SX3]